MKENTSHKEIVQKSSQSTEKNYPRPNPGLTIQGLWTKKLPQNIRSKLKLNNPKDNSMNKGNNTINRSFNGALNALSSTQSQTLKSPKSTSSLYSYTQKYSQDLKRGKTTNSLAQVTRNASTSPRVCKSLNKITSPKSSANANVYKSFRCHKYHTDLDFNYLMDQKYLKDALSCGKERNSTGNLQINQSENIIDMRKETTKQQHIPGNQNQNVLSKILDTHSQFSVTSPSMLRQYQNELEQSKREEYTKEYQALQKTGQSDSLAMSQSPIYNNPSGKCNTSLDKDKIYVEGMENPNQEYFASTKFSINLSYVGENPYDRFLDALDQVLTLLDPIFEQLSVNEKIEKILQLTEDQRRGVRLGAMVLLYTFLKKYEIDEQYRTLIIEKIFVLLQSYEIQEELFLVACLEICSLYGPSEIVIQNRPLICMFITDFNYPLLQKATFNCLMSMEYEGIKTLVELAGKDLLEYQKYILNSLIQTPHIQKLIIIRALLNEVYSTKSDLRHSALAAINRMHDLVADSDTLTKLSTFFHDGKIEKLFLSSTLRTCGIEGERILLNEIKLSKDYSVRAAIASVLCYRLPRYPKYLDIRLDNNDTDSIAKNLPGSFCTYYGRITPYVFEDLQLCDKDEMNSECQKRKSIFTQSADYLEVSTRDFLAALQRMLVMGYDHSKPRVVHHGNPNLLDDLNVRSSKSEIISKYSQFIETATNEPSVSRDLYDSGRYFINEEAIKALCFCLKDFSTPVRDTAASSLGQIGLPEAMMSIDYLVHSIHDDDINVKAKAIWAIGRISAGVDSSIIPSVMNALKSNMWKVKCACLFALSQFGERCAKQALPYLLKLLKESPINKQNIAETIVKLGNEGESMLLKLLTQEKESNYKLISCIVNALSLSNVNSSNIDFIVECLFKQGHNQSYIVRRNALHSIRVLSEKAEEKVTYLKRKHVIPFYYEKLLDKNQMIQDYAINCIQSLGSQGELILIEGLIKDVNPTIRMNCALGLAEMGPHTLRTLILGLHDENVTVRSMVEKRIIEKMRIQYILAHFKDPTLACQKVSLIIAIKDILDKNLITSSHSREFFSDLMVSLDMLDDHLDKSSGNMKEDEMITSKSIQKKSNIAV